MRAESLAATPAKQNTNTMKTETTTSTTTQVPDYDWRAFEHAVAAILADLPVTRACRFAFEFESLFFYELIRALGLHYYAACLRKKSSTAAFDEAKALWLAAQSSARQADRSLDKFYWAIEQDLKRHPRRRSRAKRGGASR